MGINRGTVLDLINDVHRAGGFKDYNSYSYLFNQVDTMPESKEDAEPHWIPCSEKLPEKDGRYQVTRYDYVTNTEFIDILWYEENLWWNRHSTGDYAVTAWMPLPEPYKGVTE